MGSKIFLKAYPLLELSGYQNPFQYTTLVEVRGAQQCGASQEISTLVTPSTKQEKYALEAVFAEYCSIICVKKKMIHIDDVLLFTLQ